MFTCEVQGELVNKLRGFICTGSDGTSQIMWLLYNLQPHGTKRLKIEKWTLLAPTPCYINLQWSYLNLTYSNHKYTSLRITCVRCTCLVSGYLTQLWVLAWQVQQCAVLNWATPALYVLQPIWSLLAQISSLEGTVYHCRWSPSSSTHA